MRRLSHWTGQQQQQLLQRLQALGAQEMQWAQALDKRTLITDVYGSRFLDQHLSSVRTAGIATTHWPAAHLYQSEDRGTW